MSVPTKAEVEAICKPLDMFASGAGVYCHSAKDAATALRALAEEVERLRAEASTERQSAIAIRGVLLNLMNHYLSGCDPFVEGVEPHIVEEARAHERDKMRAELAENAQLRADLAAAREKAGAVERLEAWGAPEADSCTIEWLGGSGGVRVTLSGKGEWTFDGYVPIHVVLLFALDRAGA